MSKKPAKKPNLQAPQSPAKQPVNTASSKPSAKSAGRQAMEMAAGISVKQLSIVLAIICFVLYANTLMNGFALDDVMVFKENKIVAKGLSGIGELLATPHMRGYLIIPNDLYRPLSLVMFAIEYQFFGASPFVGHFVNILLFAGCVILLFIFLDRFFDRKKTLIAFIAAFVFAIHPIHTEVVANMKSSDELFCYLFAFLSLNIFMNYMDDGKMKQLILGIFVFFLSLISKETVIAFLGIIPILFFIYDNKNRQRAIYITGGIVAATVVFMGIRSAVLSNYNANQSAPVEFIDNALSGAPNYASKIATEVVVMGKYLKLMFIPYPLLSNYSFNAIPFSDFADYRFYLSLLAYVGLFYVAITRFRKDHKDPWVFAIIFYLFTLFLFSNLPFLMGAELAERFAFFASTGVCIAAALAMEQWLIKGDAGDIMALKSTKVLAVLAPLLLVFGGLTVARNMDWKNNYTLYKADVEKSPDDTRLHHFVATAITEELYPNEKDTVKRHELDVESIAELRKSLAIYPNYSDAHVELGRVYDRAHQWDSAEVHDKRALELNPTNSTANNNLGNVYLSTGRYQQAIDLFKKSIILKPDFSYAYYNVALSYQQLKQYDSAIKYYNLMLGFDPKYMNAHQQLGFVFMAMQRFDSAEYHFKQVVALSPGDPNAIHNLGAAYLNGKKYALAIETFKKMLEMTPNYLNAYSNLGRAYFYSEQYDLAIQTFNKELSIDPNNGVRDIPGIALAYQKMGNMDMARKYEAIAKSHYPDFKLQ